VTGVKRRNHSSSPKTEERQKLSGGGRGKGKTITNLNSASGTWRVKGPFPEGEKKGNVAAKRQWGQDLVGGKKGVHRIVGAKRGRPCFTRQYMSPKKGGYSKEKKRCA